MALDPKELSVTAARLFIEATRELGSTRTDEEGLVSLGWSELFVRPVILQAQEPPEGGQLIALGMEVTGESLARPMRDVSVGLAPTPDEALKLAVQGWISGPYAVLHDALSDLAVPYRYGITQTNNATGESTQWSIFESPLQIGGIDQAREPLLKKATEKPLFIRLAEANALPPLDPQHVHWLKVHAARDGEHPPFHECVFDSAPWPNGHQMLEKFDWPEVKGPQTFRQYWVFTVN